MVMSDQASLQKEIYERRQACGRRLQPSYAQFLDMVNCVLTRQLNAPHPYRLHSDQITALGRQTKLFALGGIGDQATLGGEEFIYRVFKKGHLKDTVKFKWDEHRNPTKLWSWMMMKSPKGEPWVNLADFVENTYPVDDVERWFNCTWWTTFPLDRDVIVGAYTIGMFREWIDDEVYIMRAAVRNVEPLEVAHVPTVIDALMQPVFHPTKEPLPRSGGVTINLSAYKKPKQGVSEFLIKPLKVEVIQIKPVRIKDSATQSHYDEISLNDPLVLQSLVAYYDALQDGA